MIVGAVWPERALLRAQLIEEGYEVVAVDGWPIPEQYHRQDMQPRLVIVDLQRLPDPRGALEGIGRLMPPASVLVISALGTVPIEDITRLGFCVVSRPASIRDVVNVARTLFREPGAGE